MSAPSPPKRESSHPSNGGRYRGPRMPYIVLLVGGGVFVAAWAVWTFWLSTAVPM